MTTPPIGLRERNRIRTRDEILIAMSVLLGERPYESITVEDVAQQAGVSRGTIYSYFPDGREQLVRDAYLRTADAVAADGSARREQGGPVSDRIMRLAEALVEVAITPEGRFYGMMGTALIGPLGGVTGTASGTFLAMLTEDLQQALDKGQIAPVAPVEDLAVLLSGAIREIGATAASKPERAPRLLRALRTSCDALLASTEK